MIMILIICFFYTFSRADLALDTRGTLQKKGLLMIPTKKMDWHFLECKELGLKICKKFKLNWKNLYHNYFSILCLRCRHVDVLKHVV